LLTQSCTFRTKMSWLILRTEAWNQYRKPKFSDFFHYYVFRCVLSCLETISNFYFDIKVWYHIYIAVTLIFIVVLFFWKILKQQSTGRHITPLGHIIPISETKSLNSSRKAVNTNFAVIGLTQLKIYLTVGFFVVCFPVLKPFPIFILI
jgi:hypothetical protein